MATTAKGTPYVVSTDLVANYPTVSSDLATHIDAKLAYNAVTINAQTGSGANAYTFALADASQGKLVTASNAAAATYTVPPQSSVTWADGAVLRILNQGAGTVTIAAGAGVTINGTPLTLAQYKGAAIQRTASNTWTFIPFSGGVGNAAISDTPTGSYTGYNYWTYTASGTLNVTTAGFVDVLTIAGGGGGGQGTGSGFFGGGGGAGGYVAVTNLYLPVATHTITVGAGGAANQGKGNASGIGLLSVAIGGGGGGTNSNAGFTGGSGGGGGQNSGVTGAGGASEYSAMGFAGGAATVSVGGGGGGASEAGNTDGNGYGGDGVSSSITGSAVTRGGGGAGHGGVAGDGGGGAPGVAGTANTGGGGGGNVFAGSAGAGGSGIVIIRAAT